MIQIAGVQDLAEAEMLVAAGVTHLGFPLRLPAGGEDLAEAEAAEIVRRVGGDVSCVLITYLAEADAALALCGALGVGGLQLHGPVASCELARIRSRRPDLFLLRSLVVTGENLPQLRRQVAAEAELVDAFITDTFDPATGRRGATGRCHDWRISAALVRASPKPVLLAGGLQADNVAAAIAAVHPAGVDAHTGVEGRDGRKDPLRVARFVAAARAGFRQSAYNGDPGNAVGENHP